MPGPINLHEVHIGAPRPKVGMMPKFTPPRQNHRLIRIGNEHHGVGNARVQRTDLDPTSGRLDQLTQPQPVRGGQVHRHPFSFKLRKDHPRNGLERQRRLRPVGDPLNIACETSRPVAAHLRVRSIRIPELPGPISPPFCVGHQQHQPVGSNPELAVAQPRHGLPRQTNRPGAVVRDNKIVPGPGHLGELQQHRRKGSGLPCPPANPISDVLTNPRAFRQPRKAFDAFPDHA